MSDPRLLSVAKIWDNAPHNAFTDLLRWRDRWYCTFREADTHAGSSGRIRVLTSADGAQWRSAAVIEEAGVDLRDPKGSIAPDGTLMIVAGGSVYDGDRFVRRQPRLIVSTDGVTFSAPAPILAEGDWLWRVTWHDRRAWGVTYRTLADEWTTTLVRSADGRTFEEVCTFAVPGWPNEATLRVLPNGDMVALLRREAGSCLAWLGRSAAPYTHWSWQETTHRFGGPNLLQAPDGTLWAGGRCYVGGISTAIGRLTLDGTYAPLVTLPSGGDTGYPGMVWWDDRLWVSYYSSHEGKASIYLARVALG